MSREDFLNSLKSDPGTLGYELENNINTPRTRIDRKMREHIRTKGPIEAIKGAFGPETGGDGLIEEVIKNENGVFLKFYGCSILYKGYPDHHRVHGLELAKFLISDFPRLVVFRSFLYTLAVGLRAVFRKRKLIEDINELFFGIDWRVTKRFDIPLSEYRTSVREIRRAASESLKSFGVDMDNLGEKHGGKLNIFYLIARIMRFLCLFIESDTAYCYRVQDGLGNLKGKTPKDLIEVLDLMASRETSEGIAFKWKFIRPLVKLAFWDRNVREFTVRFLENLDPDKVRLDEDDWYYSLKFLSYNFRGMSVGDRWALREKIDQEKGHIFQFSPFGGESIGVST